MLKQEARKSNHEQVVEEDRLSKLPKNYEMKQMRQKWELEEMEMRRVIYLLFLTLIQMYGASILFDEHAHAGYFFFS